MRFSSSKGFLSVPLHQLTGQIPMGFMNPRMVAPGSSNIFRFAFQIPTTLCDNQSDLLINLKDGISLIPLGSGQEELLVAGERYEGDGIDLVINNLSSLSVVGEMVDNWVIADLTLFDDKDTFATAIYNCFKLVRDTSDDESEVNQGDLDESEESIEKDLASFGEGNNEELYLLDPDELTNQLIFGIDNQTAVIDGTNYRGFVLFRIPPARLKKDWYLKSPFFPDLNLLVDSQSFTEPDLLVQNKDFDNNKQNQEYQDELYRVLVQVIKKYQIDNIVNGQNTSAKSLNLDSEESPKAIPVPQITLAGFTTISQIANLEMLEELFSKLNWVPANDELWAHRYAPEAVITQGWGTENDLAVLAETILTKLGYNPQRSSVDLTDQGKTELINSGNPVELTNSSLPVLIYKDQNDQDRSLVIPFFKEISELEGLVSYPGSIQSDYSPPPEGEISVKFKVIPRDQGQINQFKDMGMALSGDDTDESFQEIQVLEESIPLHLLSLDSIDLWYPLLGRNKGDLFTAALETTTGRIYGSNTVDTGLYDIVGGKIEISLFDRTLTHEFKLKKEEGVDGLFHTLGLNLPDLKSENISLLEEIASNIYQSANKPDEISALQWYTRTIIGKFLVGQSRFESDLAKKLELTVARTSKSRCLIVTVKRPTKEATIITSIDLLNVGNQVLGGKIDDKNTFNIITGLFSSDLESKVLPGDNFGLFEIWQQLPSNTKILWITSNNKDEGLFKLEENNCPKSILEKIINSERSVIIPDHPVNINGNQRWAWLEVNPENFSTIAILDTGEHGSMAEKALTDLLVNSSKHMMGALMGVDIAIWSVSTFALAIDEYEEILKAAEEMSLEIVKMIETILSNLPEEVPDIDAMLEEPPDLGSYSLKLIPDVDIIPDLGFIQGLKDGISFYLYSARLKDEGDGE